MTEEDTFNTLKKWSFEKLDAKLYENAAKCDGVDGVIRILIMSGWTQDEFIIEHRFRWMQKT